MALRKSRKKSKHPVRDGLEMTLFAIVMALGLKVFALEAYEIPTGSMMPTLMGTTLLDPSTRMASGTIHDRVLVDKVSWWLRDPKRWEVVVFRYPLLAHQNYVKRLVGMPAETLWIREGDIWARPEVANAFSICSKPWKLQNSLWKICWPSPGTAPEQWSGWDLGDATRSSDGWLRLSGSTSVRTLRSFHDEYRDGYPASIRQRIPVTGNGIRSRNVVTDLRLQAQVRPEPGANTLAIHLDAGPFPLELKLNSNNNQVRLSGPDGILVEQDFLFQTGESLAVDLAFWDHELRLQLESGSGEFAFQISLDLEPLPTVRNGVKFTTTGGPWSIAPPTVERDIHYLPPRQGSAPIFQIPAGHYFMMGDNTQNSHDSRDWEARTLELDPPVQGVYQLRGDNFRSSSNPDFDNPRWNAARSHMTFRDQFGELHVIPADSIDIDLRVAGPFVPRNCLMGRAVSVFLPLWPNLRAGMVR